MSENQNWKAELKKSANDVNIENAQNEQQQNQPNPYMQQMLYNPYMQPMPYNPYMQPMPYMQVQPSQEQDASNEELNQQVQPNPYMQATAYNPYMQPMPYNPYMQGFNQQDPNVNNQNNEQVDNNLSQQVQPNPYMQAMAYNPYMQPMPYNPYMQGFNPQAQVNNEQLNQSGGNINANVGVGVQQPVTEPVATNLEVNEHKLLNPEQVQPVTVENDFEEVSFGNVNDDIATTSNDESNEVVTKAQETQVSSSKDLSSSLFDSLVFDQSSKVETKVQDLNEVDLFANINKPEMNVSSQKQQVTAPVAQTNITPTQPQVKATSEVEEVLDLLTEEEIEEKENLIVVENLKKSFKKGKVTTEVLTGVNFTVPKSEITTIVGPSGSGKTTILNLISGLDSATKGSILFDEEEVVDMTDSQLLRYRLENIGFVFQSYNLIPNITIYDNVKMTANLAEDPMDVQEVLDLVGLGSVGNKYPHQLSGGMQQRASFARAIVKNPKVLVCDEPTGALDEKTGKDILQMISDLVGKIHSTIIIVTHNPGIKAMSHSVIEVKDGKIYKQYHNRNQINAMDVKWA